MADYVIMPGADYLDACNAVREKTGGTSLIKSGEMGGLIRGISGGGATRKAVSELKLGDVICFGRYEDSNLFWWVIDENYEGYTVFSLVQYPDFEPSIGLAFDAAEPNSPFPYCINFGYAVWRLSNLRQFLNSRKGANEWFEPTHEYDAAPDYSTKAAFLYQFTDDELSAILPMANKCVEYRYASSGYDIVTCEDKVWVPSKKQLGGNAGTAEGSRAFAGVTRRRTFNPYYAWSRTEFSVSAPHTLLAADDETHSAENDDIKPICLCLDRNYMAEYQESMR